MNFRHRICDSLAPNTIALAPPNGGNSTETQCGLAALLSEVVMRILAGMLLAASLLALAPTGAHAAPFPDPQMQDWWPIDHGGSWYGSAATGQCRIYYWGGYIAYAAC